MTTMQKVTKYRLAIGGLTLAFVASTAAFEAQRLNNANLNEQLRLAKRQLGDANAHAASDVASSTALSKQLEKETSEQASELIHEAAAVGAFARQAMACEGIKSHPHTQVETDAHP